MKGGRVREREGVMQVYAIPIAVCNISLHWSIHLDEHLNSIGKELVSQL